MRPNGMRLKQEVQFPGPDGPLALPLGELSDPYTVQWGGQGQDTRTKPGPLPSHLEGLVG